MSMMRVSSSLPRRRPVLTVYLLEAGLTLTALRLLAYFYLSDISRFGTAALVSFDSLSSLVLFDNAMTLDSLPCILFTGNISSSVVTRVRRSGILYGF